MNPPVCVGEVAAGIAAFVLKGELKTVIQEKMSEGMENYEKSGYEGVTQTWNMIQYDFQCCGSANYTDWRKYMDGVPDNCCKTITNGCGKKPGFESEINQEGCLTKFEGLFVGNMGIVGGAAIGIFLVELFGIIIACVLACRIRKYNRIV
jgi:CD63 antigen